MKLRSLISMIKNSIMRRLTSTIKGKNHRLHKLCFRYECKTFGKNFKNATTFFPYTSVTCQANKTWSLSAFPDNCECNMFHFQIHSHIFLNQGPTVSIPQILQQRVSCCCSGIQTILQLMMRLSSTSAMLVVPTTDSSVTTISTTTALLVFQTISSVNLTGQHVLTVSLDSDFIFNIEMFRYKVSKSYKPLYG